MTQADRVPEERSEGAVSRSTAALDGMAHTLRAIPTLTGTAPQLDLNHLPDDPVELFRDWLETARTLDVPEPTAMTLSTADADGVPDSRTLILKDLGSRGFAFASTASSRKGEQLAASPSAALNFWWQPILRAVRVRGAVTSATPEECRADLAARSPQARAEVDPADWRLWWVQPERVEFWQGALDRQHVRAIYTRQKDWTLRILRGESEIQPD
ncbi:pyridoxine/pyridoxamine 5'-phosphate oxidase [Flexivirga sp. B27]